MMKSSTSFSIFIYLTFFISCTQPKLKNWSEIIAKGIQNGDYKTLKFQNDSIGYLGGSTNNKSTLLYRTLDGGFNWDEVNLKQKGEIINIKFFDEKILVLNQSLYEKKQILCSNNGGWKILMEFDKNNYVSDFELINDNELLVLVNNNSNLKLLKITSKIDTIKTFPIEKKFNSHLKKGKVYVLNSSSKTAINGVTIFDSKSGQQNTVTFNENYSVNSTIVNNNGECFLAAKEINSGSFKILKISENKFSEIELKNFPNYNLNEIYIKDNLIFIDSHKSENVGPIGITHELLYSVNNGKLWKVSQYPFSLLVKPSHLKSNGDFLVLDLMKKIQKFTPN